MGTATLRVLVSTIFTRVISLCLITNLFSALNTTLPSLHSKAAPMRYTIFWDISLVNIYSR